MELLVSKGRKRGLCAVYATQRLSKLSKNASDLQNVLVGYTGLDVDVRRAADILGFDKAQSQDLKKLRHEFFAFGPAFGDRPGSVGVERVRSGTVETHHPEPGELLAPAPPPRGRLAELVAELVAIPDRAAEEERTLEQLEGKVARLERELRVAKKEAGVSREEAEVMAQTRAREAVLALRSEVRPHVEALHHALANGSGPQAPASAAPARRDTPARPTPRPAPKRHEPSPEAAEGLTGPQRKVLAALARLESVGVTAPDRANVAAFAGYTASGGTFQNYVGSLRSAGLVDYPSSGLVALTEEGRAAAEWPDAPATLRDLHDAWLEILPGPHARILEALIYEYPVPLTREQLAEQTGYTAGGGTFQNYLGRLRSLGLADYPASGEVVATALLFPEALR